jgi:hypothetical protein
MPVDRVRVRQECAAAYQPTPAIPSVLDPALGDTGVDNAVLSSGIR